MTVDVYGVLAFGEIPPELDHSVPGKFGKLLENPHAQLVYLIELYPYDLDKQNTLGGMPPFGSAAFGEYDIPYRGGVEKVYLSDFGFKTEPSDNPASLYFSALVDNPLQFEASILNGDDFGSGSQSFGAIVIHNENGCMDYLADYYWSGRRVVIKAGARGFGYNDFAIVFDGSVNDIEVDDLSVTLTIRDNSLKTDRVLMPVTYDGTGGLNGNSDLANIPKPMAYGVLKNIEPVLVDTANLIYQMHDGSIQAVDVVRDSGVMLTNMGDVPDITVATVGAGQFKTQLSGGFIKLGSTPSGRITADIRGENTGGYVQTVPDIIRRIVKTRLGAYSFSDTDLDNGSFNALDATMPWQSGIYIRDQETASTIIDNLLSPCGAYWTFNRNGQLTVGVIDEAGIGKMTIDDRVIDEAGISRRVIEPSYRISVGYAPVWTVQNEDELAGATTQADRSFLGAEYRYVTYTNEVLQSQNQFAIDRTFKTNLANKADAESLLARLVRIYSKRRYVYQVPVYGTMFRLYLGDSVKMVYDRYNLNTGKNLLITGISEDAETGQTMLELWS